MSKQFRTCSLDQPLLLPPSLQDWLPEKHLARFIADVTEQLDLSKILADYARRDGRGMAAYHPMMMVRVLLYGCHSRREQLRPRTERRAPEHESSLTVVIVRAGLRDCVEHRSNRVAELRCEAV
jgi:hypothetical protein